MSDYNSDRSLLIDMHTHVYLPAYMDLLRKRGEIPLVRKSDDGSERVLLLKEELGDGSNSSGRPVGPQYWDRDEKIKFMDTHGIDVSIVSLANPWLDFLTPEEAVATAKLLNTQTEEYCATYKPAANSTYKALTSKRLFAFGSLPLVPGVAQEDVLASVAQIASLPHLRGVVMGTLGLGAGLDDPAMEPIYAAIAAAGLVIFVHPHYGIPGGFGPLDNGHVLPLAIGFPVETAIAISRLILAGVLDRHPDLKLLLAHSAGALPHLSSRLASCVDHDPHVKHRLAHDFRWYLGQLYYDSVTYGAEELAFVERAIARADGFADPANTKDAATGRTATAPSGYPGASRIMFGTDHPFFPPVEGEGDRWRSVDENLDAIASAAGWSLEDRKSVSGGNAVALFKLDL